MSNSLIILLAAGTAAAFIAMLVMVVMVRRMNSTSDTFTPFNPTQSTEPAPAALDWLNSLNAASSADFRLTIEDVFSIKGRGTVVTGRVESGVLAKGQRVQIGMVGGPTIESTVTAIEMFRKVKNTAQAGENVGLLLEKGIEKDQVQRGMVVTIA